MSDKEFHDECFRLVSLGYGIVIKDSRNNTATLKKGRRLIKIGGPK